MLAFVKILKKFDKVRDFLAFFIFFVTQVYCLLVRMTNLRHYVISGNQQRSTTNLSQSGRKLLFQHIRLGNILTPSYTNNLYILRGTTNKLTINQSAKFKKNSYS